MSARQSEARLRMLNSPGHLYAAYSRYCDWIKVGFTLNLKGRLEKLDYQYEEFGPFSLIGSAAGNWHAEQQLHRVFSPFRLRNTGRSRELYPAAPALVDVVKKVFNNTPWQRLEWAEYRELSAWTRRAAGTIRNRTQSAETFDRYRAEKHQRFLERVSA